MTQGQPTLVEGWPDSDDIKSVVVPMYYKSRFKELRNLKINCLILFASRAKSNLDPVNASNSTNFNWGYSIKHGEDGIQDNILRCDSTKDHLPRASTDTDIRKVGEALGSQLDAEIMDHLRTRQGPTQHGVDKLHDQLQLMSSFVAAVRGHIEKRIGLAFGNGRLDKFPFHWRTC